ncbi:hypothetical protein [Candidatus Palauibacter sp.]
MSVDTSAASSIRESFRGAGAAGLGPYPAASASASANPVLGRPSPKP